MKKKLIVRLASTPEEATAACAVLRENVKMVGFVTRGAVLKKMEQGELVVAKSTDDDSIVGCICFHVRRDRIAVIYEIAVLKYAAGSGVGSAMITWLSKALTKRAVAIKLKCTVDNVDANKFYQKIGFAYCGEERGRKRSLSIWRMELGGGFGFTR